MQNGPFEEERSCVPNSSHDFTIHAPCTTDTKGGGGGEGQCDFSAPHAGCSVLSSTTYFSVTWDTGRLRLPNLSFPICEIGAILPHSWSC